MGATPLNSFHPLRSDSNTFFLLSLFKLLMVFFQMMKTNLRGELTLYKDDKMHQFSLRDNELIDAVASHFKVGSTEVKVI